MFFGGQREGQRVVSEVGEQGVKEAGSLTETGKESTWGLMGQQPQNLGWKMEIRVHGNKMFTPLCSPLSLPT